MNESKPKKTKSFYLSQKMQADLDRLCALYGENGNDVFKRLLTEKIAKLDYEADNKLS